MAKKFFRFAGAPASLNREARTVEVVALSGYAPVTRSDIPAPDGSPAPWVEELDAAGADLAAFEGSPLLRDHRATTDNLVGAVTGYRVAGATISATIRFSTKPRAEEVFEDVAAGILKGVSLGYEVTAWRELPRRDGMKVFRATAWRPFELSLTPQPADTGAIIRSKNMPDFSPCEECTTPGGCKKLGGCVREANTDTADTPPPPDAGGERRSPEGGGDAGGERSRPAPNTRAAVNAEIRGLCRAAGLSAEFADSLIDAGATVEQARSRSFQEMQRRGVFIRTERVVQVGDSFDDPTVRRRAMATALAARMKPGLVKPDDAALPYIGHRAIDMAGALATLRGERLDVRNDDALYRAAMHTSSDFPELLADAGNKVLMAAYQVVTPTYRKWATSRSFKDFKDHKFLRVGDAPAFQRLSETGEPKYGTLSENRETIRAEEFATGLSISRRALINDELHALGDFSSTIATRAAAQENEWVYGAIAANGMVMANGKTLFHADHANKAGVGALPDVTTVGAARAAMRKQKSLDGLVLNIEGALLVVGPDLELEARQLVVNIIAAKASDANPWSGTLEVVVDAQITGKRWYLFGNPGMFPTVVYGYVNGANGPSIITERDFDTQGLKVRAGLDFGYGVIDFRGAYLNEGP